MKLIDKDELIAEINAMPIDIGFEDIDRALRVIEEQHEAVVRCRDCIYWDTQDQTANMIAKCNYYSAERYCVYTNSKDYCSGGERKTDEKSI